MFAASLGARERSIIIAIPWLSQFPGYPCHGFGRYPFLGFLLAPWDSVHILHAVGAQLFPLFQRCDCAAQEEGLWQGL